MSRFKVGEHPVPFRQTQETAKGLASVLALMAQVVLYSKLGLNLVSKTRVISLTVFLLGASWVGNLAVSFSLLGGLHFGRGTDDSLCLYAVFVVLPVGLWQNLQRQQEDKRGDAHVHTWWPGDCRLSFLPLSDRLIRLGVNPAACLIVGAFLRYFAGAGLLGLWLMLSAIGLFIVEWTVWRQSLEHQRDVLDRLDEAERDAAMMRASPVQEERTTGISTSSDASLASEIERRRKQHSKDTQEGGLIQ